MSRLKLKKLTMVSVSQVQPDPELLHTTCHTIVQPAPSAREMKRIFNNAIIATMRRNSPTNLVTAEILTLSKKRVSMMKISFSKLTKLRKVLIVQALSDVVTSIADESLVFLETSRTLRGQLLRTTKETFGRSSGQVGLLPIRFMPNCT
jgi:hypothetical protein